MPRESNKAKSERAARICSLLEENYPKSCCALRYDSPFQLLVATVLSAQTTDLAVNKATPALFSRFPDATAMAAAAPGEIEELINSIGLWRNKSKFLRGLSAMLVDDYSGVLPHTVAELVRLPGVARKTATAVLGTAMGISAGITVDTHMLRIMAFLNLSRASSADTMSKELERWVPQEQWSVFTHRVIDHGRLICVARRPRCGVCPLAAECPAAGKPETGYKSANDSKEPASAKGLSWLAWVDGG